MFDPRDDARDRDGRQDGRERVYDERDRDDESIVRSGVTFGNTSSTRRGLPIRFT